MRYRLAAGDSFDVSFELSPEFNQTVIIQPDGFVTLKAVGDVKVVGQTVPELTQTLRTRLRQDAERSVDRGCPEGF